MSFFSILLVIAFSVPTAQAYHWDRANHPANMDVDHTYQYNLNQLPLKAQLDVMPWSETYWPTYMGSINQRWNTPGKDGFYYTPPSKAQVLKMSIEDLKKLAPSEKYDLFMGHYDYPLYHEVQSYGDPGAPDWYGICDGWSIAAVQFAEPAPVVMVNPDGIAIPFGSSDIKALMSFAAAIHFEVDSRQVGTKCRRFGRGCSDINAGSMHVILANQIGLKKQGFVTERDAGREIWNQPTYGYEFKLVGSAASDADHGVAVHGILYYTDELEDSSWDPVVGTPKFKFDKIEMNYVLDLDANNNIVGGSWYSGTDHPDFMWLPVNQLEFKDELAGINRLIGR